jgi:hypothetical protein
MFVFSGSDHVSDFGSGCVEEVSVYCELGCTPASFSLTAVPLGLSDLSVKPRGRVAVWHCAGGGRCMNVKKFAKRRVKVRGKIMRGAVREHGYGLISQEIAVYRFEVAKSDRIFGLDYSREVERGNNCRVI